MKYNITDLRRNNEENSKRNETTHKLGGERMNNTKETLKLLKEKYKICMQLKQYDKAKEYIIKIKEKKMQTRFETLLKKELSEKEREIIESLQRWQVLTDKQEKLFKSIWDRHIINYDKAKKENNSLDAFLNNGGQNGN